ncbi:hypothetical protein [Arthrobacter sp. 9V]|uniref:hypothetical protein n=1 Tax=Arthrobacter sp. 9V TaxID=2653132 RepID=UPI00135A488D|nr:hypothetical protein [Arthrobacter sp. 9V]
MGHPDKAGSRRTAHRRRRRTPHAVPISNSIAGRGVAGVFAARTRSGLQVDAMGVSRDAEGIVAHQSVYGGAYTSTPR